MIPSDFKKMYRCTVVFAANMVLKVRRHRMNNNEVKHPTQTLMIEDSISEVEIAEGLTGFLYSTTSVEAPVIFVSDGIQSEIEMYGSPARQVLRDFRTKIADLVNNKGCSYRMAKNEIFHEFLNRITAMGTSTEITQAQNRVHLLIDYEI